MKTEKCVKQAFTVIGKEGSTSDGEGFIHKLWESANSHFDEIQQLAKKDESGKDIYGDFWPKWMDLENSIYRPVFIKFIPFICGIICRVLDCFVDAPVVWLRKTVYKDSPLPHELPEGNPLTHAAAMVADKVVWMLNKTVCKKKPIRKSFEHIFAVRWEEQAENTQIISRSLSYGLILFCLGLVLTIIYLMWVILK